MSSFKSRFIVTLVWCLHCVTASSTPANPSQTRTQFGGEGTIKVRVSPGAPLAELQSAGGVIVQDYGNFVVMEMPSTAALPSDGIELIEGGHLILLNAGPIDTSVPDIRAIQASQGTIEGKSLHLVQFAGPITPQWHTAMEGTGVEIVTYIPNNAYLVYGDAAALGQLQALAGVMPQIQWNGTYQDHYKIDPLVFNYPVSASQPDQDLFAIQLVADNVANSKTRDVIDRLKLADVQHEYTIAHYHNIIVRVPPEKILELSKQPDIISIQPYGTPTLFDERQNQIVSGNISGNNPSGPGYLAWLGTRGFTQSQFTASSFVVDVSDSPIDQGNNTPNHLGLWEGGTIGGVSHVAYNRRISGTTVTSPSPQEGCDGHGTINAHIVGGYNNLTGFPHADASGFRFGLGVCPFVKVGGSGIFTTSGGYTSPNFTTLQSNAYNNGARISTNSWGNVFGNTYNADAQAYDFLVRDAQPSGSPFPTAGNQEMVILFSAGNSGSAANTVHPPGTAKNIITIGASENVHAFGGADLNCGTTDAEADSLNDMATFSSRGPCSDGRKKPDLVAPGTHITGGVNQTTTPGSTGQADCFTGDGVCGGFNSIYFPNTGQQFYTASSGTSHSTPAVAGGAALIRQLFINQGMSAPSPAMTKAMLMNSTRYMTGTGAGGNLWSNSQGMGLMDLSQAFDRGAVTPTAFRDQIGVDMFTATGQTRTFTGTISDTSKPFRITLAWTDNPGATSGSAWKNNLDLTLTLGANTYRGNVFSGANSTTGGTADAQNNVESIFLPVGTGGSFTVTVTAANINSDGVPNVGGTLDQDFALVIYNATTASVPVISGTGSSITSQSCTPANGAIDPDEIVSVDFTLQNVGSANTSNVVATLQATGGVTSPSAPQNYGALTAGGSAVTRSFSFTASGACGGTLIATLQIQDGAANLGNVTFNFTLGANGVFFSQNFDGVTAPALPAGWTATIGSGSPTPWATSTTSSDTSPNALFASDPSTTTDNRITSPAIAINSAAATFSFRHNYSTEATWDGGVLEISIAGGAFNDIVTAGGSFTSGGYVGTLSNSANPLTGRSAWHGSSGGFITTTGTFPPSAVGQNVQLRWRLGSDGSVGGTGWRVDTFSVSQPSCCIGDPCGSPPATPTNQLATPASVCTGTSSSLTATVGAGETVDWYTSSCGGSLVGSGSGLNVSPATTTTYFARARNSTTGCTSAGCASVTLTVSAQPAAPTGPAATPSSICPGASSSLSASVPGGITVDWFTGSCGGTAVPGGANPSVSPASTTTYFARARNTSTGCVSATCASVTVTVNSLPATPTSPAATPSTICPGGSSTLSAMVPGGITVDWFTGSCGGSAVPGGASPPVSPAATTTYFARARNSTTGCISANCATVTVTVADTTAPTITTCASNQQANADANCQATVPDFRSGVIASDNCTPSGSLVITQSPPVGTLVGLGPTPITLTVTDAANNSANCGATYTVNDTTLPDFSNCPGNIGPVSTDAGQATAVVSWTPPTASDNCSTPNVVASHNPGFAFPIGTTSVTYTATDSAGNVQTCSFTVEVQDLEAPSILNCPTTQTLSADPGECDTTASWTTPTVQDNAPGATITQIDGPASGSAFPVGSTLIRYRALDAAGNSSFCSFDIIVADDENPAFADCPGNINLGTTNPGCDAVATWTAPTASDNCAIDTVTSTHNSGDTFPLGVTSVDYTATDVNGRQATCSFTVTVTDDDDPAITTCATDQVAAPNENCQAVVPDFTQGVVASDNCTSAGSLVITQNPIADSLVGGGVTLVTITVTDSVGNDATCQANLTVEDTMPPTLSDCPTDITVNSNAPNCAAVVTWTAPTAGDNCPGAGVAQTEGPPSGSAFANGTSTTITYTATDASNLTAICSFTITVTATADVNDDGVVDMDDIAPFVDVLIDVNTSVPDVYRADVNCDGTPDGRDIAPFTALLVGP